MKETVKVSISSGSIIKVIVWGLFFVGLFYVKDFVIALLVAVVLASAAEPPVRSMVKIGISRGLSVTILFLFLLGIIAFISFIFIPPLADDFARFIKNLPQILDSIRIFGRDMGLKDLSLYVQDLSRDISKGQVLTVAKNILFGNGGFFATTTVFLSGLMNILITFVLAFYLAIEENGVKKFLRMIVPKVYESYVEDMWERSERKISMWMQGQLLLSFFVALLVYIPMLVLGMPYAALLAIFAFFGELIPVVGLTFATIPALFIAYAHGGLTLLAIVAIIYLIISQFEGHILYPRVMNKMVGVPAVLVIISVIIGAKFAGLWGVILAVPVAAIFMEIINDLDKRKSNV